MRDAQTRTLDDSLGALNVLKLLVDVIHLLQLAVGKRAEDTKARGRFEKDKHGKRESQVAGGTRWSRRVHLYFFPTKKLPRLVRARAPAPLRPPRCGPYTMVSSARLSSSALLSSVSEPMWLPARWMSS